jgi:hypothetical protein
MKDRFTEASLELEGKNPYLCETCTAVYGHSTIEHFAADLDLTQRAWGAEDLFNPDPMPFGD